MKRCRVGGGLLQGLHQPSTRFNAIVCSTIVKKIRIYETEVEGWFHTLSFIIIFLSFFFIFIL
jgi:hypothetical protein